MLKQARQCCVLVADVLSYRFEGAFRFLHPILYTRKMVFNSVRESHQNLGVPFDGGRAAIVIVVTNWSCIVLRLADSPTRTTPCECDVCTVNTFADSKRSQSSVATYAQPRTKLPSFLPRGPLDFFRSSSIPWGSLIVGKQWEVNMDSRWFVKRGSTTGENEL